jgi:hypothetical protein
MKTSHNHQHCPEVEKLMGAKMPFVTRYGITIVVLVFFVILVIMLLSGGDIQQLAKELIKHTIEQIRFKF